MLRLLALGLFLALPQGLIAQQAPPLRTTAEATDYAATTPPAEVVTFCQELAKTSPLVHYTTYGTSHEQRPLPLLILSDPAISSIEDVIKARKPVVLAYANIHAGEVDGKEALLALARDWAVAKDPILKDAVVLFAPDINPDGNAKIDPQNRREQNGPAQGVGTRANAQGFDLNRDFIKLESPEIRALVKLIHRVDPLVTIDCHTTNGSNHRYTLTYDGPRYPESARPLNAFASTKLLPAVAKKLKETTGFESFDYGNFSRDRTVWESYPATPRFGTQYLAMRNMLGLLSESYSYASFADRVLASREFVAASLKLAVTHVDDLRKLSDEASRPRPRVVLRTKTETAEQEVQIKGYVDHIRNGTPKDYPVKVANRVVPTLEVERPHAYLIPAQLTAVAETLRRHGIRVEELREDLELEVDYYLVTEKRQQAQAFQNHKLTTLEVEPRVKRMIVPAGMFVVTTTQRLGMLAAYLLEPQAEDGLTSWNAFDDGLTVGGEFPVLRLKQSIPMITGSPRPLPEDRASNLPITAETLGRGGLNGAPIGSIDWLDDGEHFLQTKQNQLWKIHARTGHAQPFLDDAKISESLKAIKTLNLAGRTRALRGSTQRVDPQRQGFLFDLPDGGLAYAYYDGRPAFVITPKGDGREFVTFSPDGHYLGYVRKGNIFTYDLATHEEQQLTKDGGGEILNGRADWVYEEEIFHRNGRTYWWCPDDSQIAFLRFDDTPVSKFTLTWAFPNQGRVEQISYPKTGDPNPFFKIGVVSLATGEPRFLNLGDYPPASTIVSRVGWIPGKKQIYAYLQNREQTWLDVVVWDEVDSAPRKLLRDTTKAWVEDPGEPHWLADGSFLLPSERSGWKHLYHFQADGTLIRPVTQGDWEIRTVHRVDEKNGAIYFSGTKDNHNGMNLYKASLDGARCERLTDPAYVHSVSVAPQGDLFIDRETNNQTPTFTSLKTSASLVVRRLDINPTYERESYQFGKFERVQIPMADGFVLEGTITYPPQFDASKKYPIWVETYAGPHAPTVRDGWNGGRVSEQALARLGIVVFRVDPRSASGKGAVSAWASYKRLGVQELKDLEGAVDWICKNPWADATRVGLSGHSYGGYITAYALTHSKKFSAGISGAPVTDWRLYDTIYTERYMGLPDQNKEGYEVSSCITAAKNLHGKLLLIHGLVDDNVHFQNTAQFVDALQRANKPFEIMVYPRSRHGISGAHYQNLKLDFIKRSMGVQ